MLERGHADLHRLLVHGGHIDLTVRSLAHQNDRKARCDAMLTLLAGDMLGNLAPYLRGKGFPVDHLSGHLAPPSLFRKYSGERERQRLSPDKL